MEKKMGAKLKNSCVDEYQKIIFEVNKATKNIKNYIKNNNQNTKEFFIQVLSDVEEVCDCWTGKTYVGQSKRQDLKNAYQDFFSNLMKMLLLCKTNNNQCENAAAKALLYQGKVYRYLGYGFSSSRKKKAIYDRVLQQRENFSRAKRNEPGAIPNSLANHLILDFV